MIIGDTNYKDKRPTWDQVFMMHAQIAALRATCPRLHVGAVIVKDNRILSSGYNGAVSGQPHCTDVGCLLIGDNCNRSIHAEQNAITSAARFGISISDSSIYITHQPCLVCAKMIIQAGISIVRVLETKPRSYEKEIQELFAYAHVSYRVLGEK